MIVAEVADALVAQLNAGTYCKTFKAVRAYLPVVPLEESDSLQVLVVPKSRTPQPMARKLTEHLVELYVGVIQRVPGRLGFPQVDLMDQLLQLCEQITASLHVNTRLTTLPTAMVVGITHDPIYDHEKLLKNNQFVSLITVIVQICSAN